MKNLMKRVGLATFLALTVLGATAILLGVACKSIR